MFAEIESPFGNFCRTCMTRDNEAETEFQSIFDTIPNTDKPLSDLLNIFGDCNAADGMPNRMCGKCVQRIVDVHEFQQMCLRTLSKDRQLTEEKKYTGGIVVSPDLIVDATIEASDPLKEDDCTSEENMEADLREDPTEDQRPESSLSSDDDFHWPSEEETCETESKDVTNDIRTFECDVCLKTFRKANNLAEHKRVLHPPSDFVCTICGKGYKAHGYFVRHMLLHKSEGNEHNAGTEETQEKDSKEQQDPSLMQTEEGSKRKRIRKPPKPKTCDICHRVFSSSSSLNDHKRKHTEEKNFLCKECGKAFKCPRTLAVHENRHVGVKQYECPFCPKKFIEMSNLSAHKRIHSDSKPHVCDVCGAAFKFPYSLTKHKLYHSEKSVKCEQCDLLFYTKPAMRQHMLIHTGEKPYKCKYCDRAFNQSGWMMQHMRTHVGKNVYRCELCPMGFPLQKEMRKHFALHKNDDEATKTKNAEALADYERSIKEGESNIN